MLPKPLTKYGKSHKLPKGKSSIYELNKRQCQQFYTGMIVLNYAPYYDAMMNEYIKATLNEPDGIEGIRVQLSALLAVYFWWY